jgi:electron transport complex protein RnfB
VPARRAEGVARLAQLLGKPVIPLNPANGSEQPRRLALIDEAVCIGCTLCIQACPVDAIAGAAKQMHTVIESLCTGCDLCVAPARSTASAWSRLRPAHWLAGLEPGTSRRCPRAPRLAHPAPAAREGRKRCPPGRQGAAKLKEVEAAAAGTPEEQAELARKKAIIQAAMERARLKKLQAEQASPQTDSPPP